MKKLSLLSQKNYISCQDGMCPILYYEFFAPILHISNIIDLHFKFL